MERLCEIQGPESWEVRNTKNETGGQGAKTVVEPGKGVEEATWEKQRLQDDSWSWGKDETYL